MSKALGLIEDALETARDIEETTGRRFRAARVTLVTKDGNLITYTTEGAGLDLPMELRACDAGTLQLYLDGETAVSTVDSVRDDLAEYLDQ